MSSRDNTFHFNFDNIVSWKKKGDLRDRVSILPIGAQHWIDFHVAVEEFQEMFEAHKRRT